MSDTLKPVVRVPAGSAPADGKAFMTADSFQNLAAQLGYGAQNLSSVNNYGINPITRNHTQLEFMYRGSWIVKQIVDAVADDMTRAGISIESEMPPDEIEEFMNYFHENMIWQRVNSGIKWSRLYGGAICVIMVAGQRMDTPLNIETVMKGQFQGLLVLDRWMIYPSLSDTVSEPGPDFGQPMYYQVVADVRGLPKMKIHHSRTIRLDGIELPYWQTIAENGWSLSVLEPVIDRLVAFDSVTQGAAQLAFKAHLRVIRVEGLRELIAAGGLVYQAFLQQMAMIRLMQTNEGMTIIDAADEFQTNTYTFAGLPDLMGQFAQQLSGASQIPLTRLFGQSPGGMNATGESDMRNYYDSIRAQQESRLRRPFTVLFDILHRSKFGKKIPDGFNWTFAPLWQLSDTEKVDIATKVTTMVDQAKQGGMITSETALKELKQSSRLTGYWTNITEDDIKAAKQNDMMPDPASMGMQPGEPGMSGQSPAPTGQPGGGEAGAGAKKPPAGKSDGEADDQSPVATLAKPHRRRNALVARMFPQHHGKTMKDMPSRFNRPIITSRQEVMQQYGHLSNGHTLEDVRSMFARDKYPMRDFHGLTVVIETEKGHARTGYGWASTVGADYGYISGTGSAEGGSEQLDCFMGEHDDEKTVYILQQQNPITKDFDEHKVMLGFNSKAEAIAAYEASFADGSGKERVGRVSTTNVEALKSWIETKYQYTTNKPADHTANNPPGT